MPSLRRRKRSFNPSFKKPNGGSDLGLRRGGRTNSSGVLPKRFVAASRRSRGSSESMMAYFFHSIRHTSFVADRPVHKTPVDDAIVDVADALVNGEVSKIGCASPDAGIHKSVVFTSSFDLFVDNKKSFLAILIEHSFF